MTIQEREEMVKEWVKTLKPGDEVCITDVYNVFGLFSSYLGHTPVDPKTGEPAKTDIAIITTVRGILPDGCIVVDDKIYDQDGHMTSASSKVDMCPSIQPVDDNLREKAQRYDFISNIGKINWNKFSTESMVKITDIIIEEGKRIQEQEKAKEDK